MALLLLSSLNQRFHGVRHIFIIIASFPLPLPLNTKITTCPVYSPPTLALPSPRIPLHVQKIQVHIIIFSTRTGSIGVCFEPCLAGPVTPLCLVCFSKYTTLYRAFTKPSLLLSLSFHLLSSPLLSLHCLPKTPSGKLTNLH